MEKKRSLFGILVIVLVFGLMVASCSNGVSDSVKAIYLAGGSGDGISKTDFYNADGWSGTDGGGDSFHWTFTENTATLAYEEATNLIDATAEFTINAWTVVSNTDPATKNDYPFGYEISLTPEDVYGNFNPSVVVWDLPDDSTEAYKTIYTVIPDRVEQVVVTHTFYLKSDKTGLARIGYNSNFMLDIVP